MTGERGRVVCSLVLGEARVCNMAKEPGLAPQFIYFFAWSLPLCELTGLGAQKGTYFRPHLGTERTSKKTTTKALTLPFDSYLFRPSPQCLSSPVPFPVFFFLL